MFAWSDPKEFAVREPSKQRSRFVVILWVSLRLRYVLIQQPRAHRPGAIKYQSR
jgi:hypothetical protein